MNIYDAAVHVSIFQNFVCHICYFGDFAEAVESNFAVDPLIAFRGAVFVPAGFNEAGGDGVYADLLGFQFFDQGFGKKMDGGFGYSVDQRGGVSLLSGVGACEQDTAAFSYDGAELFYQKYRDGQVGVYDFAPFFEGVVFVFGIGADAHVIYQPVYVVGFFFDPGDKVHHLIIGGHVGLDQTEFLLVSFGLGMEEFFGLFLIVPEAYV